MDQASRTAPAHRRWLRRLLWAGGALSLLLLVIAYFLPYLLKRYIEAHSEEWIHRQVRIERIVSTGQASPPGFWYDQDWGEWVVLLSGAARLRLAEEAEARRLAPGDWVDIPAHCRHRVEWTDPDQPTVWLAVHYRD